MTTELYILTLAALLQCGQFLLMAVPTNMQVGDKTLTPRDNIDITQGSRAGHSTSDPCL